MVVGRGFIAPSGVIEPRIDRELAYVAVHQRVAVGRRAHRDFNTDVYHHLLAPRFGDLLAKDAGG